MPGCRLLVGQHRGKGTSVSPYPDNWLAGRPSRSPTLLKLGELGLQRIAVANDGSSREADRISTCVPNGPAERRELGICRQLSHESIVEPRRAIPSDRKSVGHQT